MAANVTSCQDHMRRSNAWGKNANVMYRRGATSCVTFDVIDIMNRAFLADQASFSR